MAIKASRCISEDSTFQCLSCYKYFSGDSIYPNSGFKYCPHCGIKWDKKLICRENGIPRWAWDLGGPEYHKYLPQCSDKPQNHKVWIIQEEAPSFFSNTTYFRTKGIYEFTLNSSISIYNQLQNLKSEIEDDIKYDPDMPEEEIEAKRKIKFHVFLIFPDEYKKQMDKLREEYQTLAYSICTPSILRSKWE